MNQQIHQFGTKPQTFTNRISAYGVILNKNGEILVVEVNGKYFLPGGGIDEGEDPIAAIKRETLEETGFEISDLEFVGNANQYYETGKLGPLNKIGSFYRGITTGIKVSDPVEIDHKALFITTEELLNSNTADFYKWAVRQVL